MEIFFDADGMMVGIALAKVESLVELSDGFVSITTGTDTFRVKGDFMETLAKVKKVIR